MSMSSLVTKIIPAYSGNFTANRSKHSSIKEITVHHMVGNMSVQRLGDMWQDPNRKGSSHYGINGIDIACYVTEGDIAWTNGNWDANTRAVTIEVANSGGAPDWKVSDDSLHSTIKLVADIAKRNNLGELVVGKNLTMHKQYDATACPGKYLESKFEFIATQANILNAASGSLSIEQEVVTATNSFIAELQRIIEKYEV